MGSLSAWKLLTQQEKIRTSNSAVAMTTWQPRVLTWGRGRAVRLHQLHLCHLFSVLLADVVLLGHERIVEGRLAHGAETVGVTVVVAARSAAGILCRFLPGLYGCWCLKGYWRPTITRKCSKFRFFVWLNWTLRCQKQTGCTHMESVDQWTSVSGSWRELCPGSATRPPRERRTSCYILDRP